VDEEVVEGRMKMTGEIKLLEECDRLATKPCTPCDYPSSVMKG